MISFHQYYFVHFKCKGTIEFLYYVKRCLPFIARKLRQSVKHHKTLVKCTHFWRYYFTTSFGFLQITPDLMVFEVCTNKKDLKINKQTF